GGLPRADGHQLLATSERLQPVSSSPRCGQARQHLPVNDQQLTACAANEAGFTTSAAGIAVELAVEIAQHLLQQRDELAALLGIEPRDRTRLELAALLAQRARHHVA